MTKSDLIDLLAARFRQLEVKDAKLSVNLILEALTDTLSRGDRVEIRDFGCFVVTYRAPRTGRNPKTGETVEIVAKNKPMFKAGKEMRERVDSPLPRP